MNWKRWLKENRSALLETPVPRHVIDDEKKWGYFIEHGHYPESKAGPSVDALYFTGPEARALLELVKGLPDTWVLVHDLQKRARRAH